ncbi:MAG: nickel pincer cofactor biosynthesis protein LarC [Acidobacteriota bacterium]
MPLPAYPFLYVDASGGASGDMFLAALVDLGYPFRRLQDDLSSLGVEGIRLRRRRVSRGGLGALRVQVATADRQPHRGRRAIRRLLREAGLAPEIRRKSEEVFEALITVEARLHRLPAERVHLHEVGALDALADVVGTVSAIHHLGVREIHASPVNVGHGTVSCAHGILPVPAPATAALLQGVPVYGAGPGERTTPTGAALIKVLATHFGALPLARIDRIGHGAGARDDGGRANLLRLLAGRRLDGPPTPASAASGTLMELRCHIDDMDPRFYGHLTELLLEEGARDVYLSPIQMKKGRPGTLLVVLADPPRVEHLGRLLLRETPSLGYRMHPVSRVERQRRLVSVHTAYGVIRVKVSDDNAGEPVATPEYEDCRRLARSRNLPLRRVVEAARAAWREHAIARPRRKK